MKLHTHTEPIQLTEIPARRVAAQVTRDGLYTTPDEVKAIAVNLNSPETLSNWHPDAVTTIWLALDAHDREWLETDHFASVR